jgi:hypothetical protein
MTQRLGPVLIFGIRIAFDSKASVSVVTPETLARDDFRQQKPRIGTRPLAPGAAGALAAPLACTTDALRDCYGCAGAGGSGLASAAIRSAIAGA